MNIFLVRPKEDKLLKHASTKEMDHLKTLHEHILRKREIHERQLALKESLLSDDHK